MYRGGQSLRSNEHLPRQQMKLEQLWIAAVRCLQCRMSTDAGGLPVISQYLYSSAPRAMKVELLNTTISLAQEPEVLQLTSSRVRRKCG